MSTAESMCMAAADDLRGRHVAVWHTAGHVRIEIGEAPHRTDVDLSLEAVRKIVHGIADAAIEARFAFKAEALEWAESLKASGEGWDVPDGTGDGYGPGTAGLSSAAVSYFGQTDAPGNCWSMRLERIVEA